MLIRHTESWSVAERDATPEHVFLNRRAVLAGGAAAAAMLAMTPWQRVRAEADPTAGLYPAKANRPTRSISR